MSVKANCVVDVVAPSEQQPVAVTAEVRWSGGVACSPHLINSTWARVHAHANEAGDSKGGQRHPLHLQVSSLAPHNLL